MPSTTVPHAGERRQGPLLEARGAQLQQAGPLPRRKPRQSADIAEAIEAGYHLAQFTGPRRPRDRRGQSVELGGETLALAGNVGTGNAGIVAGAQYLAVGEHDL